MKLLYNPIVGVGNAFVKDEAWVRSSLAPDGLLRYTERETPGRVFRREKVCLRRIRPPAVK